MIRRVVRFSIEKPGLIAGIAAALAIFGWSAVGSLPKDVLPEIGELQVIVYSQWDRDPSLLESQVTYPIVTRMMSVSRVKTVRGVSDFGRSFVYVPSPASVRAASGPARARAPWQTWWRGACLRLKHASKFSSDQMGIMTVY